MPDLLVTGGIATGKSTFCEFLRKLDPTAVFFDADAQVHELLTSPDVVGKIALSLGNDLQSPDGTLDRTRTSKLVFQDPGARRILEGILHPLVRQACLQAQHHAKEQSPAPLFIADIPLYYETGFPFQADLQIVVACGPQTQRSRLLQRSPNHDPHQIDLRLAAQFPILEKVNRATTVLWNGGDLDSLRSQTQLFYSWFQLNFQLPKPTLQS